VPVTTLPPGEVPHEFLCAFRVHAPAEERPFVDVAPAAEYHS